ncbi:hypothetical protein Tco_1176968 [Tanacetum coccineum]
MSTTNQGMSFVEIEQIVAERVANAIETIAIYETKTRMARESMSQTKQQKEKALLLTTASSSALQNVAFDLKDTTVLRYKTVQFARRVQSKGNQDSRDEMLGTLGNKIKTVGRRLGNRQNLKLCEETHESMPEPVVNEPKVVSQPKVWPDAPIIEEYESDSDDEHVSVPSKEQETPSCAFINNVKHVKTPRQTVKEQNTCTAVLTRTGRIHVNTARTSGTNTVNTARHNFNSQAVPTNAARKVNTVKPIVNNARPKTCFHKTLSPIRRSFNKTTTLKTKFSNQKVNTVEVKAVSVVGGKRETAVKPSAGCNWRPKRHYWNKVSKYNGGSNSRNCVTFKDPLGHEPNPKRHGAHDWKQGLPSEYQDFNGGPICDKKNKVLFTDTECLVLSHEFKLPDKNQVLLRVPRQNNMYSFNLENIVPFGGLACLIAKATVDESNKWHRRLGHVPKEANHSAVKSSEAKNEGEKPTKNTDLKTNEKQ